MEDCYFFLFSSCLKGSACPFRHQESCKSNGITCKNWQSALGCTDPQCSFRHSLYHLQKPRSSIPCYWEQNSFVGGCKKPDCPFMHRLKKDLAGTVNGSGQSESVVGSAQVNTHSVQSNATGSAQSNTPSVQSSTHSAHNVQSNTHLVQSTNLSTAQPTKKSLLPPPSSHPIDRLAFKRRKETVELKKSPTQTSTTDFQVKSLEQIMREKNSASAAESKSISCLKVNPNPRIEIKIEAKSEQSNLAPLPNTQSSDSSKQRTPINSHLCLLEDIDKELEEMNKLLS